MPQTTINPIPGGTLTGGVATSGAAGTARPVAGTPTGTNAVAPTTAGARPVTPQNQLGAATGINMNPISNPTHPAHEVATQHIGQAIGHIVSGNPAAAEASMHEAVRHLFAPHHEAAANKQMEQQAAGAQPTSADVKNELGIHVGNLRAMRQALRESMRASAAKPKKRTK